MNYKSGLQTNKNRLYRIWVNMKSRCYNPKASRYLRYGGRGITICPKWRDDFISFYHWAVSSGYSDDKSIDRIDSNGNYEPGNCRWETTSIQNRNKDCVPKYEHNGTVFSQSDVYELFGVKRTTFQRRFKMGLSVEEALKGGDCRGK